MIGHAHLRRSSTETYIPTAATVPQSCRPQQASRVKQQESVTRLMQGRSKNGLRNQAQTEQPAYQKHAQAMCASRYNGHHAKSCTQAHTIQAPSESCLIIPNHHSEQWMHIGLLPKNTPPNLTTYTRRTLQQATINHTVAAQMVVGWRLCQRHFQNNQPWHVAHTSMWLKSTNARITCNT